MFRFLTEEADKRGIWVIQMFYNIIVSKPFAEHYGIKTQDRNVVITPLLSDYTRKSIAAFIEKYPHVGLLICLGEAMQTYEDDVKWFTETIIPGVKDGLARLGRKDEVPIILRAHDTDCEMDMKAALPLYKNLYTMHKYNGESLCTYEPRGPWAEMHRKLSSLGSTHISNVHILANLEPFRWSSPDFIQKCVKAMHEVHGANGLHLYPQASYWDWPYTADKTAPRLLQLDRNWMWYKAWARYAWNVHRDREAEKAYWSSVLAERFGCGDQAGNLLEAYEQMGEISPKLTRKLAITEGNRQTFLLGSFMSQLVNPSFWTVYPGFHESCGPEGEMLAEWVRKEWYGEPHVGENPVQLATEAVNHADRAVEAIEKVTRVESEKEEFNRIKNDAYCYRAFAYYMKNKVDAAVYVYRYTYSNDLADLEKVRPLLATSGDYYRELVLLTKDTYLYATSMQKKQRRIPIGGDDGKNKTWAELLPYYELELTNFDRHLARLRQQQTGKITPEVIQPLKQVSVKLLSPVQQLVTLDEVPQVFTDRQDTVVAYADELKGIKGLRFSFEEQRNRPTLVHFSCDKPVSVLVGYFSAWQTTYLFPPQLETDASANDYGQAEVVISNALRIFNQPPVHIHTFTFPAGEHQLSLPKGVVLILGFVDGTKPIPVRDAGLGNKAAIDWLFQ
jgi:hypothetical protein